MNARLKRSKTDKMLAGVCGGLAEFLRWSATGLRILLVISIFFSFGTTLLIYFIMAAIMPE